MGPALICDCTYFWCRLSSWTVIICPTAPQVEYLTSCNFLWAPLNHISQFGETSIGNQVDGQLLSASLLDNIQRLTNGIFCVGPQKCKIQLYIKYVRHPSNFSGMGTSISKWKQNTRMGLAFRGKTGISNENKIPKKLPTRAHKYMLAWANKT